MLLPLLGFVLGCVVFTILGLILLSYVPSLRLTLPNLVVFVAGAFVAAPAFLLVYGKIFARNQLSDAAFVGIFPVLLFGGASGGALLVWLKLRFVKGQPVKPPTGSQN
jgi:hypothetical protein